MPQRSVRTQVLRHFCEPDVYLLKRGPEASNSGPLRAMRSAQCTMGPRGHAHVSGVRDEKEVMWWPR